MRLVVWAVGLAATVASCAPSARDPLHPGDLGRLPGNDAPYELASDNDLTWVRLQYDAMVEGTPERARQRTELAAEYARRIELRFAQDRRDDAHKAMLDLVSLWSAPELAATRTAAAELAPYRGQVEAVRKAFARAGGEQQAVAALAAMMAIDPDGAKRYADEVQEVFRYADDLAVAQYGEGAQRARPIQILETVVQSFPSPYVVDRLVELYRERQKAIESHFKRNGADFEIIRAHGAGVLKTAWNIARVLARARRLGEAPAAIEALTGLGDDADLRAKLRAALAKNAGPAAWRALADAFRAPDADEGDHVAAFAIDFEATRRFPRSADSLFAAAKDAQELGSTPLATWLYERGIAIEPGNETAASALSGLYEIHIATYAGGDRPRAAQNWLERFERFHAAGSRRWKKPVRPDLADVHAAMGRGLVGQGSIDRARAHLRRSIQIRPTLGALESLGTLELKLDNYEEAVARYQGVLALPVENLTFEFDRARVLRLIGEAYEAAGDLKRAHHSYRQALASWNSLASRAEFREPFLAEALVENGKLQWRLGHQDDALTLFEEAIDLDPNGATTHTDVVSFLIVRNQYDRALDAYHRGLGSHGIGEYFKVYMSLWMIGESRRTGRPEDPLALAYLTQREGQLWYDDLARFASGRTGLARLSSRATTRARRAEMLYYTAVLGDVRQDPVKMRSQLRDVVATDMVMFFEYDMAKHWLEKSSTASRKR